VVIEHLKTAFWLDYQTNINIAKAIIPSLFKGYPQGSDIQALNSDNIPAFYCKNQLIMILILHFIRCKIYSGESKGSSREK